MDKAPGDPATVTQGERPQADEGRRRFLRQGVKAAYVAPAVISLVVAKNSAAGSPLPRSPNLPPPQ